MDTENSLKRSNSAAQSTSDRLLRGVLALWAEAPGGEISVRAIADRAGTAVSAIDYHFGGLERLYEAAQALALAEARRWMDGRLAQLAPLSGRSLSLATRSGIIAAVIDDWICDNWALALACGEACAAARAGRLSAAHAQWTDLWQRFWASAAGHLAMDGAADTLALFFDGESSQHVLRWNRALDRALLDETATALLSFLEEGEMHPSPVREAYAGRAEGEYADRSDGAEVPADGLDEAAVEILSTQGLSALTFRAVARRAGTTLGSAAYHFGSKARMMRRAFDHLYRSSAEQPVLAGQASPAELLQVTVGALVDERQPVLRAFDEIILYICRGDEHAPLRGVIRGYRDPAATRVLESLLGRPGQVPPALAAAFSSICRGLDHSSIAIGSVAMRETGMAVLAQFRGE